MSKGVATQLKVSKFDLDLSKTEKMAQIVKSCLKLSNFSNGIGPYIWPNSLDCTDLKVSVEPAVTQNCVASVTYRTIHLAFREDHIDKTFYMSDFVTFGTYLFMENKLHGATKKFKAEGYV